MTKVYCDVCEKEIEGEIFKITLEQKSPKGNKIVIRDMCRKCINKCLDVVDPTYTYSRGIEK